MYSTGLVLRKFKSSACLPSLLSFQNGGSKSRLLLPYHFLSSCWKLSLHALLSLPLWHRPVPTLSDNCMIFSGYVITKLQWKIALWWCIQSKKTMYKLNHTSPGNHTIIAGRKSVTFFKRSLGRSTYLVKKQEIQWKNSKHKAVGSVHHGFSVCCFWYSSYTHQSLGPLWSKSEQKFSQSGLMIWEESKKQLKE